MSSTKPAGAEKSDAWLQYSRAIDALRQSDWHGARKLASSLLLALPDHVDVRVVAGIAALELGQAGDAIEHLRKAAALNPDRADCLAHLARAYLLARRFRDAKITAVAAMDRNPADPMLRDAVGVVLSRVNAHAEAIEMFRKVVETAPKVPAYHFNLATSLVYAGQIEEAERHYDECLALDPTSWKAYLARSQLRPQTPSANHIAALQEALERFSEKPLAALHLHLALAKELEDGRDYRGAFHHYSAGKRAFKPLRADASLRDERLFSALTSIPVPRITTSASDSKLPIFVFGMPRSGTTLVDRILSSHSLVDSAGELQQFGLVLKACSGSTTPHVIDVDTVLRVSRVDLGGLGDRYLAEARPDTGSTTRFVDKLPHNFLYAGFIAATLPRAKMICLRRQPMDTCFSNFRQLFALSSPYYDYSFDLMDTGRYYVMFDRLMAHWHDAMPGRILDVRYEDIVEDQRRETVRLLEFCELPWEDACLAFHDNSAPVATASAVQVRQPVHGGAAGRWRRYESELAALRALLEQAGITVE